MANTTPPLPQEPSVPPPPPSKRPRNGVVIGSAAAVIAAIIGTGIFVVQAVNGDDKAAPSAKASASHEDPASANADEPDPEPSYAELDVDSFEMKLKTTDRQCFGSAGCNVTVEPTLEYLGIDDIDPDVVYEITYEIHGDESGAVIATAELSDQTTLNYTPSSISTASASTKVTVEITDVSAQGV